MGEDSGYAYPFSEQELRNIRTTINELPKKLVERAIIEKDGKYYIELELLAEFFRTGAVYPEKHIKQLRENAPKSTQMIFKGAAFWAMTLHIAFDKLLSKLEYEKMVKGVEEK